jgi:hypothetical protein
MTKFLPIPVKLLTLDGLMLLIYVLRGVTVEGVSYKNKTR